MLPCVITTKLLIMLLCGISFSLFFLFLAVTQICMAYWKRSHKTSAWEWLTRSLESAEPQYLLLIHLGLSTFQLVCSSLVLVGLLYAGTWQLVPGTGAQRWKAPQREKMVNSKTLRIHSL